MESRDLMIIDNLNLVHYVLHKYHYDQLGSDMYQDLYQEGCIGLILAVDRFDPTRSIQFSTYAVPYIVGYIKKYLRYATTPIRTARNHDPYIFTSIDDDSSEFPNAIDLYTPDQVSIESVIILKVFIDSLSNRDKDVLIYTYYGFGQVEIAGMLGISQAQVSRILSKLKTQYYNS